MSLILISNSPGDLYERHTEIGIFNGENVSLKGKNHFQDNITKKILLS